MTKMIQMIPNHKWRFGIFGVENNNNKNNNNTLFALSNCDCFSASDGGSFHFLPSR